jgi:hypothetical protein
MDGSLDLGVAGWIGIGVLAVLEMGLLVWALVDILKRPESQLTGGKRWVWIVVVAAVNIVGPIIYFAAGRQPSLVADPAAQANRRDEAADRVSQAVDGIFGPPDDRVDR